MADTHTHHRSKFVWTWIVLGIVVVVALIWWIGDTHTTPTQPITTGAGTADTSQSYDNAGTNGATDQSANPGAAGSMSPAASPSPAASAPAMSDATTSPAA